MKLEAPLGQDEEVVLHLLDPFGRCKAIGGRSDKEDVRAMLQQAPCKTDGRPRRLDGSHGASATQAPLHDGCIELNFTILGQHASAARVEAGVLFEHPSRALDRIQWGPALAEYSRSCFERVAQACASGRFMLRIAMRNPLRTGTAMND